VSVIDGVAHLAPAESPAEIAALLAELAELAESGMPPQQPLAPVRSISPVAAPPTPGNFGTQNSGNFGTANSGNFGTSNSGNFGTANSGNFGPAPGTGSFPTSPPTGGFPAQPPTGGFPTSNPPSGGYGTPSGPTSFGAQQPPARTLDEVYDDGMRVRREVLGNAHVDRATASATEFTADFQEFITSYAWGSIWTRPGLDRRSRSMITLTALVALGHHEELAMHLRAARTNGLSTDEIKEVLMQSAIYCGVPAANTAFRIAQEVLNE
jgi:3-oxoadipate enol-lactonase/4-carboxymuconolactone decarboxylase